MSWARSLLFSSFLCLISLKTLHRFHLLPSSFSSPAAASVVHQQEVVLEAIKQAVSFSSPPSCLTDERERERKKRWDEERVIHEGIKNNDHQAVKKHIYIHPSSNKIQASRQKQFYLLLALHITLHSSSIKSCCLLL